MTGFLFFIMAIHRPDTDHKTTLPVTEVVIVSGKTITKTTPFT